MEKIFLHYDCRRGIIGKYDIPMLIDMTDGQSALLLLS